MRDYRVKIGTTLREELAEVADAWKRAERGEEVQDRVLSFESWDGFVSTLSRERLRLLRHLRHNPERSVNALARALGRPYRRVHDDVVALEAAGLLQRGPEGVTATVDRIRAEAVL